MQAVYEVMNNMVPALLLGMPGLGSFNVVMELLPPLTFRHD